MTTTIITSISVNAALRRYLTVTPSSKQQPVRTLAARPQHKGFLVTNLACPAP